MLFSLPIDYIVPNLEAIYNYNKFIAIALLLIILLYCVWYVKYTLNKVLFSNYKRYEIITSLKEINYSISSVFLIINLTYKIIIASICLHYDVFIPILISNTIIDYIILSLFCNKYVKIKKKDVDPIYSDVFFNIIY